ncbi:FeoB-associated Cys-rich membrane protein [Clostridium sp. CTA-5]
MLVKIILTFSILSYTIWIIQRKIKDIKRGKFCNCNCSNCASKNCK